MVKFMLLWCILLAFNALWTTKEGWISALACYITTVASAMAMVSLYQEAYVRSWEFILVGSAALVIHSIWACSDLYQEWQRALAHFEKGCTSTVKSERERSAFWRRANFCAYQKTAILHTVLVTLVAAMYGGFVWAS